MKAKLCATLLTLFATFGVATSTHAQISIVFDYTYDTGGFFDQTKKDILNLAATALTGRLGDSLSAITPGGNDSWSQIFEHPSAGGLFTNSNSGTLAADRILVYAGARDLGTSVLGRGGPGGADAVGSSQLWLDTVFYRGENQNTDFGPWGGSIAFDSDANWHLDTTPETQEPFSGNDFYSVALHELGHLLGIGTADSWMNLVSGGNFNGSAAMALNGGNPVPLADVAHWQEGLTSPLPGELILQELAMDPTIVTGTRKYFTDMDFAGLDDLGWDVVPVPEPYQFALVTGLGLLGFAIGRRRSERRA